MRFGSASCPGTRDEVAGGLGLHPGHSTPDTGRQQLHPKENARSSLSKALCSAMWNHGDGWRELIRKEWDQGWFELAGLLKAQSDKDKFICEIRHAIF